VKAVEFTVGILTASDKGSRGEREDISAAVAAEVIGRIGGRVAEHVILPDEKDLMAAKLREWADERAFDLILTSGGTGLSPRDVTPEATMAVAERLVPGIPEAMRLAGLKATPRAMLSRAVAVIRRRTLIINLPGGPRGVRENLEAILEVLPHALEVLRGEAHDCARPED
jgi:molybdenum cofactor synthesis domain-containing protein